MHSAGTFFQIRYCEELGISPERASELFIYYGLCSTIGRLLAGILCNHPSVGALTVFQAATFVSGLSTMLVTLARTYTPFVVFSVFYGFSDGFFFCTLGFLILTVSPSKTAAVLGWEMMVVSFFIASGPGLTGKCPFIVRVTVAVVFYPELSIAHFTVVC